MIIKSFLFLYLCQCLAGTLCSQAAVLVHEPFDYSPVNKAIDGAAPTNRPTNVPGGGDPVRFFAEVSANGLGSANLKINELMASNVTTRQDEYGEYDNWIEIYNPSDLPVDMGGMYLTDDLSKPTKWRIPDDSPAETTISAQGYLLIWADGDPDQGSLHVGFNLENTGEEIGLFAADGSTLVSSITFASQIADISFGSFPDGADNGHFFDQPTPEAENVSGYLGRVAEPEFSVGRGLYDQAFDVVLTCPTDGATLYYTLDSTDPTEASTPYTRPIAISGTTCLRVAGFKTGYLPSVAVTHTYIFVTDVIEQAEMSTTVTDHPVWGPQMRDALLELPVISLVTPHTIPDDPIMNPPEVPTSIEMILPDGAKGFQANAGVERFGGQYTLYAKQALRISFKKIYGPSRLKFDLFGDSQYGGGDATDSFNQIILRNGSHDALWYDGYPHSRGVYTRNRYCFDRQIEMGHLSLRGTFVHVYLNGVYWGQYHLMERPTADFMASYLGGDKEDYDIMKGRSGILNLEGNRTAWDYMIANSDDYEIVKEYLDIDNYIDYMLLNFYGANDHDWYPSHNWVAGRRREAGNKFMFFMWDNDFLMRRLNGNTIDNGGPGNMFDALIQHEEFKIRLADRAQQHFFNDGMLTPNRVQSDFTELTDRVARTVIPECARWSQEGSGGAYTPDALHQYVDWIKFDWGNVRTDIVIQQMRDAGIFPSIDAPAFSQHGGRVRAGFQLTMTGPGTIYYTLDGTDPRGSDDTIAAQAIAYNGPVVLNASVIVKARALSTSTWSALNEAEFTTGRLGTTLRFTEIMYHPIGDEPYEYLEIQNIGSVTVDLNGYSLSGVTFAFRVGDSLAPGERTVLANNDNLGAFATRYPGVALFGSFGGKLSNDGEKLTIKNGNGDIVTSVDYDHDSGWPITPDGQGPSLVVIDVDGDPDAASNWRASVAVDGTPGLPPAAAPVPMVILNEVLAYNVSAFHEGFTPDWAEILNSGGSEVDLEGWILSDDIDSHRFVFPVGSSIPAGGYLRVWCDTNAISGLNAGFALDFGGESLALYDASSNRVDVISWGPQAADYAIGRVGGEWVLTDPTMAAANTPAVLASTDQLSINEWLADPLPGKDDWVELYNKSATLPVSLQGIYVSEGQEVTQILSLTFIGPNGFLRLKADNGSGPDHLDFGLPANGGEITLFDSTASEIETVVYGLQTEGVSEGRLPDGTATLRSFPGSVSPAASNYLLTYSGPVLNELLARNTGAVADSQGRFVDWVELYNNSGAEFDLTGMTLSDKKGGDRWTFPAGLTIPNHDYLVVEFDATRAASMAPETDLNTGLGLDGNNGGVYLFNAAGQIVDSVEHGFQIVDQSIGLSGGEWKLLTSPTPGAANSTGATLGDPLLLRINEWLANPSYVTHGVGTETNTFRVDDWFEFFNLGSSPVSLAGLFVTDDLSIPGRVNTEIPPLSFIGGHGYVQVIADGSVLKGRNHVNFNLNADGDAIRLYTPDFTVIDTVQFGFQAQGGSQGRLPNGGPAITPFAEPTPGSENPFVPGPPIIVVQPANTSVMQGETAVMEVLAGGAGTSSYQWLRNGLPIPSATSSTLTFDNAQSGHQAEYSAVVMNEFGSVRSGSAFLAVEGIPPSFVVTVGQVTVPEGSTVTLTVVTEGSLPMGYRWRQSGLTRFVVTQTNSHISVLTIPNVTAADAGVWDCIATNAVNHAPGALSLPRGRVTVVVDTDGDGMSDGYENSNGLNPNDASDADGDLDGDGSSNLAECQAGTDPNDAQSLLRIDEDSIVQGANVVIFAFDAVAGHGYSVQCAPVTEGPWISVQNVLPPAASGSITVTNPVPLGPLQKYFRIVTPIEP